MTKAPSRVRGPDTHRQLHQGKAGQDLQRRDTVPYTSPQLTRQDEPWQQDTRIRKGFVLQQQIETGQKRQPGTPAVEPTDRSEILMPNQPNETQAPGTAQSTSTRQTNYRRNDHPNGDRDQHWINTPTTNAW